MPTQTGKKETSRTPTAAKSKRPTKTEWNIMFYIAGDSDVSATMISQLKELTDAGFQKDTTVLVYFDPNCNGTGARIFDVNRLRQANSKEKTIIGDGRDPYVRNIAEDCHIPVLPQLPAAVSLRYFLEYSRSYYPARNYMLFLMGHGVIVGNDAFLPDTDDESAITLSNLGEILKKFGRKIRAEKGEFHLVGFHSCSMSSVELACQLEGSARYMIGTQGSAFPGSWPYRQLLKKMFCVIERNKGTKGYRTDLNRNRRVEEILRGIQDLSFCNSKDFLHAGCSSDLSLCSLDKEKVNSLSQPLKRLVRALKKGLKDDSTKECILLAHLSSQSYWGENYSDLYDLCSCLSWTCKDQTRPQIAIRDACRDIMDVLASNPLGDFDRLIVYSDFFGPAYQYSHGLSIFFPWTRPNARVMNCYSEYAFTKRVKTDSWLSFLKEYFYQTQRGVRGGESTYVLQGPPGKVGPPLGPPPKAGSPLGPPGKVGQPLGPPGKVGQPLGPPGKVGQPLGPPGKAGQPLGPPGKVGQPLGWISDSKLLSLGPKPPDKTGGNLAKPPDKVGPPLGLNGVTVIKNFTAPENFFVTSRPSGQSQTKQKNLRGKRAKKRGKPAQKAK